MAQAFYTIRRLGDVYVPARYRSLHGDAPALQLFALRKDGPDRILRHLRHGGVAVIEGDWREICKFNERVQARRAELITPPRAARLEKRDWERQYRGLFTRLMVRAEMNRLPGVAPPFAIPYLLEFLGEWDDDERKRSFLTSVPDVIDTLTSLAAAHPVDALGARLLAHQNVLAPRSQETLHLIRRALVALQGHLAASRAEPGRRLEILDMGCGSGCCTFIAAQVFADRDVRVTATDHLPEAIATTRLNLARLVRRRHVPAGRIQVTAGGDLFEPLRGQRFDVIVFNAPWVVAPARHPAETATHDGSQQTLHRFLREAPGHLHADGRIILGYSDHSGPQALDALRLAAAQAGLEEVRVHKDRIQTRRQAKRWESVLVYELQVRRSAIPKLNGPGSEPSL